MSNGLEDFKKYTGEDKTLEAAKEMAETMDEDIHPCTAAQRAYIYGMCSKAGYDPRHLPKDLSSKEETRDLTIVEAKNVINMLKVICEDIREEEETWGLF